MVFVLLRNVLGQFIIFIYLFFASAQFLLRKRAAGHGTRILLNACNLLVCTDNLSVLRRFVEQYAMCHSMHTHSFILRLFKKSHVEIWNMYARHSIESRIACPIGFSFFPFLFFFFILKQHLIPLFHAIIYICEKFEINTLFRIEKKNNLWSLPLTRLWIRYVRGVRGTFRFGRSQF